MASVFICFHKRKVHNNFTDMTSNKPNPIVRKIAIMGYPCVGKSSITLRFVQGHFPESYNTTIEDMHSKSYRYNNKDYKLQITDTAGQQEYSVFPHSCSVGIDGYILVYAIDDDYSFTILKTIYDKILESAGDSKIPIVLIGNKLDLESRRRISTEEGKKQAASWGAEFLEISAKDNEVKVCEIFNLALGRIDEFRENRNPKNPKTVQTTSSKCTIV